MSFCRRSRYVGDNVVIGGMEKLLKSNTANNLGLEMVCENIWHFAFLRKWMKNILCEMKYINKQTWLAWSKCEKTQM